MLWSVHVQKVPQASQHFCLAKCRLVVMSALLASLYARSAMPITGSLSLKGTVQFSWWVFYSACSCWDPDTCTHSITTWLCCVLSWSVSTWISHASNWIPVAQGNCAVLLMSVLFCMLLLRPWHMHTFHHHVAVLCLVLVCFHMNMAVESVCNEFTASAAYRKSIHLGNAPCFRRLCHTIETSVATLPSTFGDHVSARTGWRGVSTVCFRQQGFFFVFVFLRSPAISLGFTTFGRDFCVCDRFFNPTIKVVTFCLRGWCVLGVFLLPAFTRLGHERQDLLSPYDEMHVCTD